MQNGFSLPPEFDALPHQMCEYADALATSRVIYRARFPRAFSYRHFLVLYVVRLVGAGKTYKTRWQDLETLLNAAFRATDVESPYTERSLRRLYASINPDRVLQQNHEKKNNASR